MSVLLETSFGDVVIDLYTIHAPKTSRNFLKLCKLKYYNDCEFFLINKNFIIQTGDPSNTGKNGALALSLCNPPGQSFAKPEISKRLTHAKKGTVSMASSENGVYGSQFFITMSDKLHYLDRKHTPFGEVAEGWDVVNKIANEFVDEDFQPYRIVRIRHTITLHDPFEDYEGMPRDVSSPEPTQGGRENKLGSDEEADGEENHERQEVVKRLEEAREARSRAEVLEMIGDIADADLKPPDNVLFICKLNPLTQADDLEIIFSRFGECKVDILKDRKTGDSLCYGFIEYETSKQCERAYFKMDAVIIDDRRVKVDFSQSVSKLWNKMRREKQALARLRPQGPSKKRARVNRASGVNTWSNDKELMQGASKPQSSISSQQRPPSSLEEAPVDIIKPRRRSRFDIGPT